MPGASETQKRPVVFSLRRALSVNRRDKGVDSQVSSLNKLDPISSLDTLCCCWVCLL